jgi:hypothetical protein
MASKTTRFLFTPIFSFVETCVSLGQNFGVTGDITVRKKLTGDSQINYCKILPGKM